MFRGKKSGIEFCWHFRHMPYFLHVTVPLTVTLDLQVSVPAAFEALHTYSPESDLVTAAISRRATPLAKLKLHLSEALISLPAFSHWIRIGCDPWTWQLSCRISPSSAAAGWRGWSKTGGFLGSGIWKRLSEYSGKHDQEYKREIHVIHKEEMARNGGGKTEVWECQS